MEHESLAKQKQEPRLLFDEVKEARELQQYRIQILNLIRAVIDEGENPEAFRRASLDIATHLNGGFGERRWKKIEPKLPPASVSNGESKESFFLSKNDVLIRVFISLEGESETRKVTFGSVEFLAHGADVSAYGKEIEEMLKNHCRRVLEESQAVTLTETE